MITYFTYFIFIWKNIIRLNQNVLNITFSENNESLSERNSLSQPLEPQETILNVQKNMWFDLSPLPIRFNKFYSLWYFNRSFGKNII